MPWLLQIEFRPIDILISTARVFLSVVSRSIGLAAWPLLINVLTHVTIVWEVTYAALVWPRLTRPLVVLLAVPLHLGIAVCMGMITFGLVMIVGNVAFVSPAVVRSILEGPFQRGRAGRSHKSG